MTSEVKSVDMLPVCYGCGTKPVGDSPLLICGRCRANKYCSQNCIKNHWKSRHKQTCPILSIALINPLSKTCLFWKCALKYEPMTDPEMLLKHRSPELLQHLPVYGTIIDDQEKIFQIGPLGGCPEGLEFLTGRHFI